VEIFILVFIFILFYYIKKKGKTWKRNSKALKATFNPNRVFKQGDGKAGRYSRAYGARKHKTKPGRKETFGVVQREIFQGLWSRLIRCSKNIVLDKRLPT